MTTTANAAEIGEYGIRWLEFDRQGRAVCKEKTFRTAEARDHYADLVWEKPNFWRFESWLN